MNFVPFICDHCLVPRMRDGTYGLPGGTLELGEDYWGALVRELVEELGARVLTFEPLGGWHCHSSAAKPYRAHIPHPDFYRFVGYGDVQVFRQPTTPSGGEDVEVVDTMPVEEAHKRFVDIDRPELGEFYLLAALARFTKIQNRKVSK